MIDLKKIIAECTADQDALYASRAASEISNYERILQGKIQASPSTGYWSSYLQSNIQESQADFLKFYDYLIDKYVVPGKTQMTIEYKRDDVPPFEPFILFSIGA